MGDRAGDPGRRAARAGGGRRPPAALRHRRGRRRGLPGQRRDQLAAVLASGELLARPQRGDRVPARRPHRDRAPGHDRRAAPARRPPIPGLELGRVLGVDGTRLYGLLGDKLVGYIEVDTNLAQGGRLAHLAGWADIGNLHVDEADRRRGVATWLVGQAADWLRLARVDRLLDYAWPKEGPRLALLRHLGFCELTRTARGWTRHPDPAASSEVAVTPGPPA